MSLLLHEDDDNKVVTIGELLNEKHREGKEKYQVFEDYPLCVRTQGYYCITVYSFLHKRKCYQFNRREGCDIDQGSR